jgi:class 3 adenylate cyclase
MRSTDDRGTAVRTFLIADIRGYSTFTRERGHEEAARLAGTFVDHASDAVEAHGGRIGEIRGDQVLALFPGPIPAVREAVDLQLACVEETGTALRPLPAGVGVDGGESTRSEEGYHGVAINRTARLSMCWPPQNLRTLGPRMPPGPNRRAARKEGGGS